MRLFATFAHAVFRSMGWRLGRDIMRMFGL